MLDSPEMIENKLIILGIGIIDEQLIEKESGIDFERDNIILQNRRIIDVGNHDRSLTGDEIAFGILHGIEK